MATKTHLEQLVKTLAGNKRSDVLVNYSTLVACTYNTINFWATQQVLCRRKSIGRCSYVCTLTAHQVHAIYIHSVIVWDNPTTVLIYTKFAKSADGERGEIHPEHIKWVVHCVQNDKRFDHNVLICDSSICLIFCDCQLAFLRIVQEGFSSISLHT